MHLINADALEREGWYLNRIIQKNKNTMEYQTRKPTEFPAIEPERKTGKWHKPTGMMPPEYAGVYRCSECDGIAMRDWKTHKQMLTDFCPNCGSYNGGNDDGDE